MELGYSRIASFDVALSSIVVYGTFLMA